MLRNLKLFIMCALVSLLTIAKAAELPLTNNGCEFAGTFVQNKFIDELDTSLKSRGQFYHHCEYGVIWDTSDPINETLLLLKEGQGYLLKESSTQKLKSRQGKFLGKLLNGLMSADQDLLSSQFKITRFEKNNFVLLPIKRSLKRAIKSIQLRFESDDVLNITVLDRNSQKTGIKSNKEKIFTDKSTASKALLNCQDLLHGELLTETQGETSTIKKLSPCLLLFKATQASGSTMQKSDSSNTVDTD